MFSVSVPSPPSSWNAKLTRAEYNVSTAGLYSGSNNENASESQPPLAWPLTVSVTPLVPTHTPPVLLKNTSDVKTSARRIGPAAAEPTVARVKRPANVHTRIENGLRAIISKEARSAP